MQGIKYFPQELKIRGKRIIVRVDLNVPIKNKKIQDYTRIAQTLPFLQNLINRKSKIILISHLGRPKGIKDSSLSLLPIYKYLKEKLNTNMYFYAGEINDELNAKCSYLKNSEILLIENIRFLKKRQTMKKVFLKKLVG